MNGNNKKSTYYSWIWDQVEIFYTFYIPSSNTILIDLELESFIKKMIDFHHDYYVLSRKFKIGEFLTDEYLMNINTNIKDCFFDGLEENLFFNGLSFFPFNTQNIDYQILFSSKVFYFDKKEELVHNYLYGMYSGANATGFCDLDYWKLNKNLPDNILDFSMPLNYRIGDYFNEPLEFKISILSNMFYPFLETGFFRDSSLNGKLIDNRKVAYLNAPRFNSYLRDLKDLFINKFGWGFKFEYEESALKEIKYLTEEGILLDNKIIYQEDIDSGRIKLP